MDSDWALVEYRRGRYVKVTSDGTVLGRATDEEIKAWFSAHGWRFGRPGSPEPAPVPDSREEPAAVADSAEAGIGEAEVGPRLPEGGFGPPEQPTLPAFGREAEEIATAYREPESELKASALDAEPEPRDTEPATQTTEPLATEPESDAPPVDHDEGPAVHAAVEPAVSRPADTEPRLDAIQGSEQDLVEPDARSSVADVQVHSPVERNARAGEEPIAEDYEPSISPGLDPHPYPEPGETSTAAVRQAVRPLPTLAKAPAPVEPARFQTDATDRWLWVDPRQERGYSPAAFEVAGFLDRAVALFRSKPWSGGQEPRRLAVHPSGIAEPLESAAEDRDLELVADPKVAAGTYMLALAERESDA